MSSFVTQTGSTATTTYAYEADFTSPGTGIVAQYSNRYSVNDLPQWGNVQQINNPDDSWAQFTYNSTQGWLTKEVTPPSYVAASTTANTVPTDTASDEASDVVNYYYDPSLSGGGDPVNPLALVERPRETEEELEGVFAQAIFVQYVGDTATTWQISEAGTTDPTWDTAQPVSKTPHPPHYALHFHKNQISGKTRGHAF